MTRVEKAAASEVIQVSRGQGVRHGSGGVRLRGLGTKRGVIREEYDQTGNSDRKKLKEMILVKVSLRVGPRRDNATSAFTLLALLSGAVRGKCQRPSWSTTAKSSGTCLIPRRDFHIRILE